MHISKVYMEIVHTQSDKQSDDDSICQMNIPDLITSDQDHVADIDDMNTQI